MDGAAIAVALEAAEDGDVAAAGLRLALHQLRSDRADRVPAAEQRRRFDKISSAVRQLEQNQR